MRREYELVHHSTINNFKIFFVSLLYREPHIHGDLELFYVLDGSVLLKSRGKTLCCPKNSFVLLNSCQPHEISAENNNYALILALQIMPGFCRDYFPHLPDMDFAFCTGSDCFPPEIHEIMFAAVIKLSCLYFKKEKGFEFSCISLLNLIFHYLIRYIPHRLTGPEERRKLSADNNRIQSISRYIDEHYQEKLLLTDIAEKEGLSVSYLSHFFKEHFQLSFQKYLAGLRCEKARQLLLVTEHNLLDISMESGFSDIKYMNKAFYEKYGCTPKEYRKEILRAPLPYQQKAVLSTQSFFTDTTSLVLLEQYDQNATRILESHLLNDIFRL